MPNCLVTQLCVVTSLLAACTCQGNLLKSRDTTPAEEQPDYAPRWVKDRSDDPVFTATSVGSPIDLKCRAEGKPQPKVQWYKDGKPFTSRKTIDPEFRRWSMRIPDATIDDVGNYSCEVTNRVGKLVWYHSITVNYPQHQLPPVITSRAENRTVYVGDDTIMECRVMDMSGQIPIIQWIKHYQINGSWVTPPEDLKGKGKGKFNFVTVQSSQDHPNHPELLELNNVTLEDAGWYTCIALNNQGNQMLSQWLFVEPAPNATEATLIPIQPQNDSNLVLIMGVLIGLALVFLCVFCAVMVACVRLSRHKRRGGGGLIIPHPDVENALYTRLPNGDFYIEPDQWEFDRKHLTLGEKLGEGCFGQVVKAYVTSPVGIIKEPMVAVKMLKSDATEAELDDLVQEMDTMKQIGQHKNIINFLGCCTQDGPLYVLTEFAPHGNLRDYLKHHRPESVSHFSAEGRGVKPLTEKNLTSYAYQVARGMEYLSSNKLIHRDLAARNVLVGEDEILKIADYGLARDVTQNDYYRKTTNGLLPVKWMAPEAMFDGKYDIKSDVWSYGVLLWEIFSFGGNPYPSVPLANLFALLRDGHRMEKPPAATIPMFQLMLKCWKYLPEDRCNFNEIVENLEGMLLLASNTTYLNLHSSQSHCCNNTAPGSSATGTGSTTRVTRSDPEDSESTLDDEVFEMNPTAYPNTLPSKSRPYDSQYSSMTQSTSDSSVDKPTPANNGENYLKPCSGGGSRRSHRASRSKPAGTERVLHYAQLHAADREDDEEEEETGTCSEGVTDTCSDVTEPSQGNSSDTDTNSQVEVNVAHEQCKYAQISKENERPRSESVRSQSGSIRNKPEIPPKPQKRASLPPSNLSLSHQDHCSIQNGPIRVPPSHVSSASIKSIPKDTANYVPINGGQEDTSKHYYSNQSALKDTQASQPLLETDNTDYDRSPSHKLAKKDRDKIADKASKQAPVQAYQNCVKPGKHTSKGKEAERTHIREASTTSQQPLLSSFAEDDDSVMGGHSKSVSSFGERSYSDEASSTTDS